MRALDHRLAMALAFAGALACGAEKPSAPAAPRGEPAVSTTQPAPQPDPVAPATSAGKPAADAATAGTRPVPAPSPAATKPAAPAATAPIPAPSPPASPAKPPAAPAASAHAKVGADKCKMCHRLQHQSWAESAHAKKGLDCEGCHGNGGDYWPASVMRDRAKAVAAGLVQPGVDRCRACHPKADASLLAKAHAHKAR